MGIAWSDTAKERGLRTLAVVFLSLFIVRAALAFQATHKPVLLLLIVAESLTVALAVIARAPLVRSMRPFDIAISLTATYYFLFFVRLGQGDALLPSPVPELIQVVGIGLQIFAKATLGRSFGLLPANRGVVRAGPYRVVRHPIYFSYLVGHVGFVLGFFSWYNLAILVPLYALQLARIVAEERVLMADPAYAAYAREVRWRLVPGVI
jgi:protein-S-isoprenylcysteine O-methyltransferase Ste14